jgi:hypothetical protein
MRVSEALREYAESPDRFAHTPAGSSVERFADERVCIPLGPTWAPVSGVSVGVDDVQASGTSGPSRFSFLAWRDDSRQALGCPEKRGNFMQTGRWHCAGSSVGLVERWRRAVEQTLHARRLVDEIARKQAPCEARKGWRLLEPPAQ